MYTFDQSKIYEKISGIFSEHLQSKKLLLKIGFREDKEFRAINHFLAVFLATKTFGESAKTIVVNSDRAAAAAERVYTQFMAFASTIETSLMAKHFKRVSGTYKKRVTKKVDRQLVPQGKTPMGVDIAGSDKLVRAEFLKMVFCFLCISLSGVYYVSRALTLGEKGLPSGSVDRAVEDMELFETFLQKYKMLFAKANSDPEFNALLRDHDKKGDFSRVFYFNTSMSRMLGLIGTNILKDQPYLDEFRALRAAKPEQTGQVEPWI